MLHHTLGVCEDVHCKSDYHRCSKNSTLALQVTAHSPHAPGRGAINKK